MRSKLILIMAIIMGLATTFLFYKYIDRYESSTEVDEKANLTEIVSAGQEIMKNQLISAEMLKKVEMDITGMDPVPLSDAAVIVGKYATSNIVEGEPIYAHRLQAAEEESTYVARKVSPGMRAVSVGVNINESVSNLVEPEDRVDVIFVEQFHEGGKLITVTTLLLEDVRVLAVGRRMIATNEENPYTEYSSATLELNQQDSVTLVDAAARGSIHLTLHSSEIPADSRTVLEDD